MESQWMSLEELNQLQVQLKAAAIKTKARSTAKCVEQIHLVTDQVLRVYPSITTAANFMGMNTSDYISACCKGKVKTCAGFKWRFYDGPLLDCKCIVSDFNVWLFVH